MADDQDAPYRATVLEPVGKLNNYYSTINAAITKREHKVSIPCSLCLISATSYSAAYVQMTDYDSARAKVKKLVEKPADDAGKLPRVGSQSPSLDEYAETCAMAVQLTTGSKRTRRCAGYLQRLERSACD